MNVPIRRVVNVRSLPKKGRSEAFEADGEVRESLARFLDVPAVEAFSAEADVTRWRGGGVRVAGRVRARLAQECVVTLEPIETEIDEPFDAVFVPEDSPLAPVREGDVQMMVDAEGDDPPETFAGDTLDLGPIWSEFLTLAVDPFPRRPDAQLADAGNEAEPSPFAALAALKDRAANSN